MKKLLIGLFLIFVLVLSGCVSNGTSVEQVLLANQMINDFKDQHPNAQIQVALWNVDEIEAHKDKIVNICEVPLSGEYYHFTLIEEDDVIEGFVTKEYDLVCLKNYRINNITNLNSQLTNIDENIDISVDNDVNLIINSTYDQGNMTNVSYVLFNYGCDLDAVLYLTRNAETERRTSWSNSIAVNSGWDIYDNLALNIIDRDPKCTDVYYYQFDPANSITKELPVGKYVLGIFKEIYELDSGIYTNANKIVSTDYGEIKRNYDKIDVLEFELNLNKEINIVTKKISDYSDENTYENLDVDTSVDNFDRCEAKGVLSSNNLECIQANLNRDSLGDDYDQIDALCDADELKKLSKFATCTESQLGYEAMLCIKENFPQWTFNVNSCLYNDVCEVDSEELTINQKNCLNQVLDNDSLGSDYDVINELCGADILKRTHPELYGGCSEFEMYYNTFMCVKNNFSQYADAINSCMVGDDSTIDSNSQDQELDGTCLTQECFESKYKTCEIGAKFSASINMFGYDVKYVYEIVDNLDNYCTMKSYYVNNPNPDYINKFMYCKYAGSSFDVALRNTLEDIDYLCSGDLKYLLGATDYFTTLENYDYVVKVNIYDSDYRASQIDSSLKLMDLSGNLVKTVPVTKGVAIFTMNKNQSELKLVSGDSSKYSCDHDSIMLLRNAGLKSVGGTAVYPSVYYGDPTKYPLTHKSLFSAYDPNDEVPFDISFFKSCKSNSMASKNYSVLGFYVYDSSESNALPSRTSAQFKLVDAQNNVIDTTTTNQGVGYFKIPVTDLSKVYRILPVNSNYACGNQTFKFEDASDEPVIVVSNGYYVYENEGIYTLKKQDLKCYKS